MADVVHRAVMAIWSRVVTIGRRRACHGKGKTEVANIMPKPKPQLKDLFAQAHELETRLGKIV